MNLFLRLLKVVLLTLLGPRKDSLLEECEIHLRVWPNDLDTNLHVNNGRYLTIMDLGRADLTLRMGLLRPILRNKWRPVVASLSILYRKPLKPFQKFKLKSRVVAWREHWIFLEQSFWVQDTLYARALVKGVFLGPQGKVHSDLILASIHQSDKKSPELSKEFESLLKPTP